MNSVFSFKKNTLIKGAFIICVGGFLTKIIGAIYRIPLTNVLGAEGIGIYQMVFPLYSILLTLSSTGVPNGISKLIASGYNPNLVLKKSLKVFVLIGLICTAFLAIFANKIATIQGDSKAGLSYLAISPAVVGVSIICCFRGYYQGFANMKPTAISQILEQIIKLCFGLLLAYLFRKNVILSSFFAVLSVSISEILIATYFLINYYKKPKLKESLDGKTITVKILLKTIFPVMLSTLVLPLTRTIESFLILNILNKYTPFATSLYGLYSGVVESLVGVPVALLYGIAITSVPIIARENKVGKNTFKKARQSIFLTLILAVIFGGAFILFSRGAINLLYPKLNLVDKETTINMLKIASLSVVFLPLMQTLSSLLIALEKLYAPCISSSIASIFKIILTIILLNIPSINIFAVVITDIVCYVVACFLDLVYYISIKRESR